MAPVTVAVFVAVTRLTCFRFGKKQLAFFLWLRCFLSNFRLRRSDNLLCDGYSQYRGGTLLMRKVNGLDCCLIQLRLPVNFRATSIPLTYSIFKLCIVLPFANKKAPHMRGYCLNIRVLL
jgi:hypothetical protein